MRIGVDLDGVICELRAPGQTYADVAPVVGAIAKLKALRAAGHEIVIFTARHMKTTGMNVGRAVARQGLTTLRWLDRHGVEFDEIWFGKPHCDVYLDDNAVRFITWDEIAGDGSSFPAATETQSRRRTRMNLVVPMAGDGARFQRAGYDVPKPLICVNGEPLYALATRSLPLEHATRLIFIIRKSMDENQVLSDDIRRRFDRYAPRLVTLEQPTEGQSITVLHALNECLADVPLLVFNCDSSFRTAFDWNTLTADPAADGALATFRDASPRWSFVRRDTSGAVVEVAEKRPISDEACTGAYWFRTPALYERLATARARVGRKEAGEYYIAPLYNDLIAEQGRVLAFLVDEFHCFGTPEDLTNYLNGTEPWLV